MRAPTRHPRLSAVACKVYGLTIYMYPTKFRRALGHELVITFRNRVEDVLNGSVLDWLAFVVHIALDWIQTCSTLMTESEAPDSASLLTLGLNDGDAAQGGFVRTNVDVSLVFVAVGWVLSCVGWYSFVTFVLLSPTW